MDIPGLLEEYSLDGFPAGLGGCRNGGTPYGPCEYDVSVFDERTEPDTIAARADGLAAIHHCSLSETRSDVLVQLDGLGIIRDESWELRMLLSKIGERRGQIYRDCMRNCLIDSLFCITKSRTGLRTGDPFAPCWTKCSAIYLADAILLYHTVRPSPAHLLQDVRRLGNSRVSARFSAVTDCIGTERSTPVLLERMSKSTIGFSDMVEGNDHSRIIGRKCEYMIENSMHADCHAYLTHVNCANIIRIKDTISRRPDLIHTLKVALDIENDPVVLERQAGVLYDATNSLLSAA